VGGADEQMKRWLKENEYETAYLPFAGDGTFTQGVMTAIKKVYKPKFDEVILRNDGPRRFRPFNNIRGLISAVVEIDGQSVSINNVHLTYPRPHVIDLRKREFKELKSYINQQTAKNPWLLCGDFNFLPIDKRRSYLTMHYNNFTGTKLDKTWKHGSKYSAVRANLDYLFWDGKDINVDAKLAPFNTSDHRPILATISI
jgi:endonuclease/exonuclease/phosphatase (EEP) superfamily protein YafD